MADAVRAALRLFPATEFSSARVVTRPSTVFLHTGTSPLLGEEAKKESCTMGETGPDCSKGDPYRHVEVRSTGNVQGLPRVPDGDAVCAQNEVSLFWGQYMAVEEPPSQGLSMVTCNKVCRDSSGTDFEWSALMDQKEALNTKLTVSELKDDDRESEDDSSEIGDPEESIMAKAGSSKTDSVLSRSSAEGHFSFDLNHLLAEPKGIEKSTKCSSRKDVFLGNVADNNRDVAPVASHRYHAYFENCDLPPSQSTFSLQGPVTNMAKQGSLSGDKLLLEALIRMNEPTSVETGPVLPALLGTSDPTPFFDHPPSIARPLGIPSGFPQLSTVNRVGSQSEEQGSVSKRAYETLGQALCHSQTRARQAEKVAAQALDERERIVKMLFREAWIARTYKQWMQTLEFENMWLRACSDDEVKSATDKVLLCDPPVCASQKGTEKHLKKQEPRQRQRAQHGWTSENLLLGYTIGLAFALGLSFAGAGLVIGWHMGLISLTG